MLKYFWITVDIINSLGGFYGKYCSKNLQITNGFRIKSINTKSVKRKTISVNKYKDNIGKEKGNISQ